MKTIIFVALALACVLSLQSQSQTSVQSTGPADALLDHLTEIQTDISLEQAEHDKLYNSQHAECEDEFAARTEAIEDGEDALLRSQAQLSRCDAALAESQADLLQTQAYTAEINDILKDLETTRNTQKADYEKFVNEEIDPAVKAIQGAYPIIDSYSTGSSSFVEVTQHMSKSFKAMVKVGKAASMAAPLSALLSMSEDFDQEAIARVKTLFQKLESDLVDARTKATELENSRQKIYDETVAEYNTILTNLENTEAQLVAYIAEMEACVTQEGNIVKQASAKVANNTEALKYALQMCSAFEEEYNNATAGRKAELELLAKLEEFVKEQAELFGDYGPESSGVFEAYKKEYEKQVEDQVSQFIALRNNKQQEHLSRMKNALRQ